MTIKVGIIGCGSIAKFRHAPEYNRNKNAEIAAFYDPNRERAEALASIYGAKVVDDYMDIITDPEIDAISDCSTNEMHHIISTLGLKNNKSVLCEKPMATSVENAMKIIEAKQSSKGKFLLDHNQRLTVAHRKAKAILESGELGQVISFRTTFGHKGPEYWGADKTKNNWFFNKNRSMLGVAGDLGIHKVDLLRFLLNQEMVEVTAMEGALNKKDEKGNPISVSDNMACILKTNKGIFGSAIFSWTFYGGEDNSTMLYCEKGTMRIYDDSDHQIIINKFGEEIIKYQTEKMQTNDNQTSTGIIDEFIDVIMNNKEPLITEVDGIKSLMIIESAIKSAKTGQTIMIEE